jgi:SPP1 family phage portal protein
MEIQEILDLVAEKNTSKLVEAIKSTKDSDFKTNYELWVKQWNTKDHTVVTDKILRPDKVSPDGKPIKVARIPFPFQKLIVRRAAQFLCGNPIEIEAKTDDDSLEDKFVQVIKKTWDDNKLDYDSKTLAKLMMSETEAAELWFFEKAKDGYWAGTPNDKPEIELRLRMKILANKYKDTLYPVFNPIGDMIAFARGYATKTGDKMIEHLDIYTDEKRYLLTQTDTGWDLKTEEEVSKKIPAVYYQQDDVEWVDVQWMIERIEILLSKLADTNDYFAHPVLALEAESTEDVEWPEKDQSGKAVLLKNGAKAGYITLDNAAESIKLELLQLRSSIMDMTDTPDISFDQVKGLGSYSGIALKMIFSGAHMKASEKEEIFGKGIQRRINFLKAAHAVINGEFEKAVPLSIKPRFTYYTPKDTVEETNVLINAMGGGKPLISQKTAIELSSLVKDAKGELERIQEEETQAQAQQTAIGKSTNGLDNLMNAVA